MPITVWTDLTVRRLDPVNWEVMQDLSYQGRDDAIVVHRGFTTDFATVPWFMQWLIPRTGTWTLAAVVHDYLCVKLRTAHKLSERPRISARDTDALMRRIMREDGVDPVRRWLIWTGIRWGALANPARREGWVKDAPLVLTISGAVLAPVIAIIWGLFA